MRNHLTKLALLATALLTTFASLAQVQSGDYLSELLQKKYAYYTHGIDEKLYLQLDKPYYSAGDQIWFKGYLRNAITHAPLEHSNFIYVELIDPNDALISRVKVKRDSTGFNGYMNLDAQMPIGHYTLRGYTRWMQNKAEEFFFSRSVQIISPIVQRGDSLAEPKRVSRRERERTQREAEATQATLLNYDLQFFPEGGALLSGGGSVVAFKGVGEDGLSVELSGSIYDSSDSLVCNFSSTHKGMGIFNMYVAPNESYYAKAISAAGVERIVALPTVEDVGAVIDAMLFSNRLVYRVRSSSDEIIEGAHIVINAHGRIAACSEVHPNHTSVLASDQLLEGINIISLISASGEVLSERLIFKYPTSMGELSMSCDRENYGRRERVGVTLSLHDSFGEAAAGEFGISVTDDSSVHFDRGAENIVSYLTLSSDIYGYIEEPGLYFVEDDPLASKKIDLLMRTQGWRRFDVEQILAETTPAPTIPYESMVEIKGSVKGFFGNAARNPVIHVLNADLNYFDSFKLDNSNLFKLQGLDLPDSTIYVIQAKGRKGGNSLTLLIEPERFPAPKANMGSIRRKSSYVPQAFINQSQDKFFYEGGMNLIDIDAVYVSVDKSPKSSSGVDSSRSTGREELDLMSGLSLPMILQRYPSISISEEGVTYRSNNSMARFILDGFDVEYDFISTMTSDEIERIDFYEGAAAVMYSDAAGGVFVLESRSGVGSFSSATEPLSMAKVAHLGYQRHATHYQPRYDNPSLRRDLPPDHRTTLFWSGELCPNTQGEINFEFFTADKATHYTVWVEGITEQGELLRKSFSIERTADR